MITGKDITNEGWLKEKVLKCPRRKINMTDKNTKLYLTLFLWHRKDKSLRQLHILFGGLAPFQFVYCIQIFQLEHFRSRALYIFSSAYNRIITTSADRLHWKSGSHGAIVSNMSGNITRAKKLNLHGLFEGSKNVSADSLPTFHWIPWPVTQNWMCHRGLQREEREVGPSGRGGGTY